MCVGMGLSDDWHASFLVALGGHPRPYSHLFTVHFRLKVPRNTGGGGHGQLSTSCTIHTFGSIKRPSSRSRSIRSGSSAPGTT